MVHSFNGFGKYGEYIRECVLGVLIGCLCFVAYLPAIMVRSRKFCRREFTGITDTFAFLNIVYPVPLFALTLYYNYGWDYGLTGLHLVYPLIPLIPYLLNGHRSRDLLDLCQIITGLTTSAIGAIHRNYYVAIGYGTQAIAYYFNSVRGNQYKQMSAACYHNFAMALCCWMMYLSLLQSCVDSGGTIDCCRVNQILESNKYCTEGDCFTCCE